MRVKGGQIITRDAVGMLQCSVHEGLLFRAVLRGIFLESDCSSS